MFQVQQLSVSYGETAVLRSVDLAVPAGKLVCLMGRNGVGKTTLLKSIMGQLRPSKGTVSLEGVDLTHARPEVRARAGIGYVPQGREIFPQLTVMENLQIGLEANPRRLRVVPDIVFTYFPMLKTMLGRKGGVLSGGQQQQLAIARARISGRACVRSMPLNETVPLDGRNCPMMLLSSVVLPTPLRPIRQTSFPAGTSRSTPRRTAVSP